MEKLVRDLFEFAHAKHLTQNDLARMLHVSKNTIGNWKKGAVVMTAENARAIESLIASPPDERPAPAPDSHILQDLIFAVVDLDIDDASKTKVIRLVKSMLDKTAAPH